MENLLVVVFNFFSIILLILSTDAIHKINAQSSLHHNVYKPHQSKSNHISSNNDQKTMIDNEGPIHPRSNRSRPRPKANIIDPLLVSDFMANQYYRPEEQNEQCLLESNQNISMAILLDSIDRCPDPNWKIREIFPSNISWNTVRKDTNDQDNHGQTIASGYFTGKELSSLLYKKIFNTSILNKKYNSDNTTITSTNRDDGRFVKKREKGKKKKKVKGYLVFLLVTEFDYFSLELSTLLTSVAPAFPEITFVRGEIKRFTKLVAQISIKGFPQLLLFEDGLLKKKFRGERSIGGLSKFLIKNTGGNLLPHAVIIPPPKNIILSSSPFSPSFSQDSKDKSRIDSDLRMILLSQFFMDSEETDIFFYISAIFFAFNILHIFRKIICF